MRDIEKEGFTINRLFIIGNLTRDPELRSTPHGLKVCTFDVAVNRRKKQDGQPDADFFRVSAWREIGENCSKYLAKGRKVAVTGSVRLGGYKGNDGQNRAYLDVTADEVEFLSAKGEQPKQEPVLTEVGTPSDLPF